MEMARALRASCRQLACLNVLVPGIGGHFGHTLLLVLELAQHGSQPLGPDEIDYMYVYPTMTGIFQLDHQTMRADCEKHAGERTMECTGEL
ncbi:hypothetical protein CERZMDRAFT_99036 [Cercospora zeae-maydis SCOH1-5]|uniref:Uncharacterized protein n=1 Tax=Cercospora zeae-maydis SCOH1-5 TaxID=717836 RepID=A0A6A6FBR5_9PEZI|nr:hypothetical protein CERZMDRAFT_99036 [Cercospora zeae-maydis SCOH1-5]